MNEAVELYPLSQFEDEDHLSDALGHKSLLLPSLIVSNQPKLATNLSNQSNRETYPANL